MNTENELEFRNGYAYWRPTGTATPILLIAMFKQASDLCRGFGAVPIFLDARALTAPEMKTIDRFHISVEIGKFWDNAMKVAVMCAPGENRLFDEFGLIAARNCGIRIEAFESEAAALGWLVDRRRAGQQPELGNKTFRFELA